MSSSSTNSSEGMEGAMMDAFQAEYEEAMLNLEAESSRTRRHRQFIRRDREGAHDRLYEDYFADNCTYPPNFFRRRYRMRRQLFLRIVHRLGEYSPFFSPTKVYCGFALVSLWSRCGYGR